MKSWLEKNDIEIYSAHNEGKSVFAERFVRSLKIKIFKYMTWISKNVYNDKLDEIVNKYNNTFHNTIKMKPVNVVIIKILHLKLVIMLEYENIKVFLLTDVLKTGLKKYLSKILYHGHMLLMILMMKKLLDRLMKKIYKRQIKKSLK